MTFVIIIDFVVFAVILSAIAPRAERTKECSADLFWAGVAIAIYNLFFALRGLLICICSYYSKSPITNSTLTRIIFICIDCVAYTTIVIWATTRILTD